MTAEFRPGESIPEVWRRTSIEDEPPAEAHPKIAQLIRHWRGLAPAPGLLPGRRQFDPFRVAPLMPHLWLVDFVPDDGRRYRARLVGGALVEAGVQMRKGEYFVDFMTAGEAAMSVEAFDRIRRDKFVSWRRGPSALRQLKHIFALERTFMPLASDGQSVDMFLCMTLFYWNDGRVY